MFQRSLDIRISCYLLVFFMSFSAVNADSSSVSDEDSVLTNAVDNKTNFVLGNLEFVLLHELAHLVVDDKNVPQLGPPESIADYIAIHMAIAGDGSESAKRFLTQALLDAATSFALSWKVSTSQARSIPYWDTHALGIQRYYTSMCLLYGSSPKEYQQLAQFIPDRRRAGCNAEFSISKRGYDWLLEDFSDKLKRSTSVSDIQFEYGPVNSRAQDRLVKTLQSLQLIENTVNSVDELFGLSRPIKVSMRRCRQAQAAWQPAARELTICYEMLDAFEQIYALSSVQKD